MDINDKVVIITGASEGIGLATAKLFAERGAKEVIAARSADKLQQIASEIPNAVAIPTDMRDESQIDRLITQTRDTFGRIDVLINNAGQAMHVPIEKADPALYRSLLELNVVSVMIAMQKVIPIMRQQGGGVIINISSGTSKRIIPNVGPYSSTKYALNAITLTARMELAADNIRVGLVVPGVVPTNFRKNGLMSGGQDHLAGGRPGAVPSVSPEHVAEKILEAVQTEEAEVYTDGTRPG